MVQSQPSRPVNIDQIQILLKESEFVPEVKQYIQANLWRFPQRLKEEPLKQEPLALACYGPSLLDFGTDIEKYRFSMTCSGAHDFILGQTYHVECDWRPHKAGFVKYPKGGVEYLFASCVNPVIFDNFDTVGFDTIKLWNVEYPFYAFPKDEIIFPALGCVGLQCIPLAHLLGFRELHIYGMDCSFLLDGERHAGTHNGAREPDMWVQVGNRIFRTSLPFVMYAKTFVDLMACLPDMKVHLMGDGLLQEYVKYLQNASTRPTINRGLCQGFPDKEVQQTDGHTPGP